MVPNWKLKRGFFRRWAISGIVLLMALSLHAQQDAQYTQYMYNTISVNPAYAGSRGHLSMAALYRAQWVGLDGAPVTKTLNFHTPTGSKGLGIGLSFVGDDIGPTSETYLDLDLSYTVKVSTEGRLGLGLKASAQLLDIRFSELHEDTSRGSDARFEQNIDNRFSPNIGAGAYYYTNTFYAGLSIPRLLETEHFDESNLSTAQERMNWYFMTGYVLELSPFLKFKPTLLAKWVAGASIQADISANFMFNDKFIIGTSYRWDAASSALLGFNISNKFLIGIAYDREITDLGAKSFNSGSFEVIFRYDLVRNLGNIKSPRFF